MANPFADPSVAGLDAEKQYTPGTVPDSFYEENLDVPPTSSLMGESNSSSETPAWLSDSSAVRSISIVLILPLVLNVPLWPFAVCLDSAVLSSRQHGDHATVEWARGRQRGV